MDRSAISRPERPAAMRAAGGATLDLLLPAAAGGRGESTSAPQARRALHGLPVFRQPSYGRHAEGRPQAHPAADADSGNRSPLSETEPEPSSTRPRGLPIPAA